MVKITYVGGPDGDIRIIDAEAGSTVMSVALMNNVEGIVAECGGSCSCATCHVYVDERWADALAAPEPEEAELLECLDGALPNSRLSCQLVIDESVDGLRVILPEQQNGAM